MLYIVGIFVKYHIAVAMWIYAWVFCSFLFIYSSCFVSHSCHGCYCDSSIQHEIRCGDTPRIFSQNCFEYLESFVLAYSQIILPISGKMNFDEYVLNLYIDFSVCGSLAVLEY